MKTQRLVNFLLLVIILTNAPVFAQSDKQLEEIMLLNRSGKWEQAAQLAEKFLNDKQSKESDEQCEAIYSLAYARTRLGRTAEAQKALANYDKSCGEIAPTHWLPLEINKLRHEFA